MNGIMLLLLEVCSLVLAVGAFSDEPNCHPGWQQVNRFCYKVPGSDVDGMKSEVATWAEAGRLCQASNAHLMSIDSAADDLIIKTRRAKQMWGLVWVDYSPVNRSLYHVPRMDGMCPALNCTSGQYQFAPCHGYRYYMCKASLDPEDETATLATPMNRYAISADRYQEQQQNPGSAVFKIGGGIVASLIAVLLLWMAAGIGLVVYLRRRINRDMERNAFDPMTANQQPLSSQSSNGTAEDDSLMETKRST